MEWLPAFFGGGSSPAEEKPKTTNVLDTLAVKRQLDELATEVILDRGYEEDNSLSNTRMAVGLLACATALLGQFYPKKFPDNVPVLIACILTYLILNVVLQYLAYFKEKEHILFTSRKPGSFKSTGLAVSSKLGRFDDMYTLRIASADPGSISAHPPVEFTTSYSEWFTSDGVFAESLFWDKVEELLTAYEKGGAKKSR